MPTVNGLEEEFAGEIDVTRLDATDSGGGALQKQYGLRGHPSFAVLDENGEVVERFFGPQGEKTLRTTVELLLNPAPPQGHPNRRVVEHTCHPRLVASRLPFLLFAKAAAVIFESASRMSDRP